MRPYRENLQSSRHYLSGSCDSLSSPRADYQAHLRSDRGGKRREKVPRCIDSHGRNCIGCPGRCRVSGLSEKRVAVIGNKPRFRARKTNTRTEHVSGSKPRFEVMNRSVEYSNRVRRLGRLKNPHLARSTHYILWLLFNIVDFSLKGWRDVASEFEATQQII